MFTRFLVQRLSVGSVYKIAFVGLATSLIPLGIFFGVLAIFGFDTVRWNNEPVYGFAGFLLGPVLGLICALMLSAFLGTACTLGLLLYSKFRPLSLKGKNVAHGASSASA